MSQREQWIACIEETNKCEDSLTCHLIKFSQLQKWFWPLTLDGRWPVWISDQVNRTECRIVPIDEVKAAVGFTSYVIHAPLESYA